MNIKPVSFGKKIPVAQGQIKNYKHDYYIPATLYELDCTDKEDIDEISSLSGKWLFRKIISNNMNDKFNGQEDIFDTSEKKFYILQLDKGETVGIMQVHEIENSVYVDYIESKETKNNKYKYIGQLLLSTLGADALKRKMKTMVIATPIPSSISFYTEKCGFNRVDNILGLDLLKMDRNEIKKFVSTVEEKTKSPIVDIRV